VILISSSIWHERFRGSPNVLGQTVGVEGRPYTVLGVLPPRFSFGGRIDAIVPMPLGPAQAAQFASHSFDMYARLAPRVTPTQAAADLTRIILATQGNPPHATGATLVPLRDEIVGDSGTSMLVLFGAVALVLLIACANIANLLLARASARQREIAVRTALCATRRRVVRQLVTESLLLAFTGGALGIVLAMWLTDLLARIAADSIPRAFEIAMDGRGLLFAVGVSVLCGVIFGLAPAWHASGLEIGAALKQEARGGSPAGRRRILSIFVVSEIALALVLLVGASLLLTTFRNLRQVDAGFYSTNVLTAPAYLPEWKYEAAEKQRLFFQRATAALAEIPGVTAAAAVNVLPLSGNNSSGAITLEGFPLPPPNQRESADRRAITPAYFAAMGIRLSAGRAFTDADNERAPGVVIVSRALAEHYWPGSDPLGKRLKLSRYTSTAPWLTIVGIAGDVRHGTLAAASRQVVYYPHAQIPSAGMELVVRIAGPAGTIPSAMRDAVRRLDPDLPVDAINPMAALVRASLFDQMLELGVLGTFALLAVVLAAAGVYGVMAYTIAEREQEFGIRLALGASPADIVRLVGFDGARLTLAGTAFGLAAAWAGTRLLSDLLYGVRPNDLAIFASTASVLALIAMAACIVPTVRALRVNLLTTLRAR